MGRKPKSETPVFNRLEKVREARGLTRNTFAVAYSAFDWRLNDLTDGGPR